MTSKFQIKILLIIIIAICLEKASQWSRQAAVPQHRSPPRKASGQGNFNFENGSVVIVFVVVNTQSAKRSSMRIQKKSFHFAVTVLVTFRPHVAIVFLFAMQFSFDQIRNYFEFELNFRVCVSIFKRSAPGLGLGDGDGQRHGRCRAAARPRRHQPG